MRTLFVASEIFPFAKSGGLADVAASLPKALQNKTDIQSIMPLYGQINTEKYGIVQTDESYSFWMHGQAYHFTIYQKDKTLFIKEHSGLFDRAEMYGDYWDNDIRFGVFCYAVMEYITQGNHHFDLLHLNDWQSALIALLVKEKYKLHTKLVFTIHNLAYQGVFSKESIDRLDLSWDYFTVSKLEFFDQVNFLKSAISYCDIVTTVSPTYALEIQTKTFGCDLENLIQDNAYKLRGILNGIDYEEFHPSHDSYLPYTFDEVNLSGKRALKEALLKELYLKDADKPLFVFIGRFTGQKGIDQILESLHQISELPMNVAILGSGEEHYNHWFGALSGRYENISITIGYNEPLARKLYGASDFLYMPSQYEPCGLNQMIAMKYGSVPIVRSVGGLKDSVSDFDPHHHFPHSKGVGITFEHGDVHAFMYATNKALGLYHDVATFSDIVNHNMHVDFSWDAKSKEYLDLYELLASGWLPERKIKSFEIPTHYGIDTLKCIPVNPTTLYSYWEITQALLSAHHVSMHDLRIKAYVEDEEKEEGRIYDRVGNYYFYPRMDFKSVQTKIGYYDQNGAFITILESNRFIAPNETLIKRDNIVWRDLATLKKEHRRAVNVQDGYEETSETINSMTMLKRKHFGRHFMEENAPTSTTLHKGGN